MSCLILPITSASADCPALGEIIQGDAIAYDGDGIHVGEHKIRLWGIQAPEFDAVGGRASTQSLTEIAEGAGPVRCVASGKCSYNRPVSRCWAQNGADIAREQVSAGHAVDWPKYSNGFYSRPERP